MLCECFHKSQCSAVALPKLSVVEMGSYERIPRPNRFQRTESERRWDFTWNTPNNFYSPPKTKKPTRRRRGFYVNTHDLNIDESDLNEVIFLEGGLSRIDMGAPNFYENNSLIRLEENAMELRRRRRNQHTGANILSQMEHVNTSGLYFTLVILFLLWIITFYNSVEKVTAMAVDSGVVGQSFYDKFLQMLT